MTKHSASPTETEKAQKRAERKEYQKRKEALLKREKENYEYIAFMKATGGFYVCVGHSAVILARKIAKGVGLRFILKTDRDFGKKSKEGIITITKRDYYREKLKNSPYLTLFKDDKNSLVFKLDRKLTLEEYEALALEEQIKRQELEESIVKAIAMPKLSNKLLEVLRITYRFYRKNSDACSREFILNRFCERIEYAHRLFLEICRGEHDKNTGLAKIDQSLSLALCEMVQISELQIWGYEESSILSIKLIEAQNQLRSDLKRENTK